jgi:predicted nucleotidyltransferase
MNLEEAKNTINKNLPFIKEKYKVKEMGIFGSYATGEQGEKSDLDILVEFSGPITLLKYAKLKNFLEDKINLK